MNRPAEDPEGGGTKQRDLQGADAGGALYLELIKDAVQVERGRKTLLEQKAVTVITTAAALVGLLFGLAGGVMKSANFSIPAEARVLLVVSLAPFLVAALCSILTIWTPKYSEVDPARLELHYLNEKIWTESTLTSSLRVARILNEILKTARKQNNKKTATLMAAIVAEGIAILFVAADVAAILMPQIAVGLAEGIVAFLIATGVVAISPPLREKAREFRKMNIKRSGSQPSGKGPAEYFTGTVRIDPLFQANAPARAVGASVTFEPGARTAWHTHPLGQTLIVTTGCGLAQRWDGPIEEIRPGDVIWVPPGEKHWHGATPTTAMTHTAIQEQLDGKAVEWMEKVSDEQYQVR